MGVVKRRYTNCRTTVIILAVVQQQDPIAFLPYRHNQTSELNKRKIDQYPRLQNYFFKILSFAIRQEFAKLEKEIETGIEDPARYAEGYTKKGRTNYKYPHVLFKKLRLTTSVRSLPRQSQNNFKINIELPGIIWDTKKKLFKKF